MTLALCVVLAPYYPFYESSLQEYHVVLPLHQYGLSQRCINCCHSWLPLSSGNIFNSAIFLTLETFSHWSPLFPKVLVSFTIYVLCSFLLANSLSFWVAGVSGKHDAWISLAELWKEFEIYSFVDCFFLHSSCLSCVSPLFGDVILVVLITDCCFLSSSVKASNGLLLQMPLLGLTAFSLK